MLKNARQLGIAELPQVPVKVEVVPYDPDDRRFIKYLFRYNTQQEALIVDAVHLDACTRLIPAGLSGLAALPKDALPSADNGEII